ncbi:GT2 family glycosyltransferase [Skermanella aerolata]|uniref:glycosyltransferase family 2 protein n=1 Tax=Skermanella aerolata TaxID=393310 RepID=UPI003D1ACBF3
MVSKSNERVGTSAAARGRFRLHAVRQLTDLGGGRFESTGTAPRFDISAERHGLPTGWVRIRFSIADARPYASGTIRVTPDGDQPTISHPLPSLRDGHVDQYIRLPDSVRELCFDPMDQPGVFTITGFRIDPITRFHVLARAALRNPGRVVAAAGYVARHGVAAAKLRMAERLNAPAHDGYKDWVALFDTLADDDIAAIGAHIAAMRAPPLISVLMPVYDPDPGHLAEAIGSVIGQIYPHWELCIADDASTDPAVRRLLADYAKRESRIRLVTRAANGHISAASNSALELATGEYLALLDHDDLLPAHALYRIAADLEAHGPADLIYSDEDKIDGDGRRHEPHFKSDWNPELFLAQNMISHLGVYRTGLVRAAGGFRVGFEGSQDWDLALRVTELTKLTEPNRIRHIPHILYHWRVFATSGSFSTDHGGKAAEAGRRAVAEHLERTGQAAQVVPGISGYNRVRRALPDPVPRVSLIVPTRDRVELLRNCIDGLLDRTDYPDLEVLIVDNASVEPETLAYFDGLAAEPRVRILRREGPFNFSALNNDAATQATGSLIGFVNNDIEVIEPGWLSEMASHAARPGVGAVGAKLLYGDGKIQHAGVILGVLGVAGHTHKGFGRHDYGYFSRLRLCQNLSCVTAACMVMPKAVFESVGGFDAVNLAIAFNDVDLCIRIREAGYQVIWTPYSELYHLESASRGSDLTPENRDRFAAEVKYMQDRWGDVLRRDPYYNPNLSLDATDFSLAGTPRVTRPWQAFMRSRQPWRLSAPAALMPTDNPS